MQEAPTITFAAAQADPKTYPIRELFARGEARLLMQQERMIKAGDDLEQRVDAAVDILQLLTGADVGDLNSLHLKPLLNLIHEALGKYNQAYRTTPAAAEAPGNDQAPE